MKKVHILRSFYFVHNSVFHISITEWIKQNSSIDGNPTRGYWKVFSISRQKPVTWITWAAHFILKSVMQVWNYFRLIILKDKYLTSHTKLILNAIFAKPAKIRCINTYLHTQNTMSLSQCTSVSMLPQCQKQCLLNQYELTQRLKGHITRTFDGAVKNLFPPNVSQYQLAKQLKETWVINVFVSQG